VPEISAELNKYIGIFHEVSVMKENILKAFSNKIIFYQVEKWNSWEKSCFRGGEGKGKAEIE
jgi:hypothetical protein